MHVTKDFLKYSTILDIVCVFDIIYFIKFIHLQYNIQFIQK